MGTIDIMVFRWSVVTIDLTVTWWFVGTLDIMVSCWFVGTLDNGFLLVYLDRVAI